MKRRVLPEDRERGGVNISPMIDVVFILLIFFVVTTVFVDESGYVANRPVVDGTGGGGDPHILVFEVDRDGSVSLNDVAMSRSDITNAVAREVALDRVELSIFVQAHPESPAMAMLETYDAVRLGGYLDVSLQRMPTDS